MIPTTYNTGSMYTSNYNTTSLKALPYISSPNLNQLLPGLVQPETILFSTTPGTGDRLRLDVPVALTSYSQPEAAFLLPTGSGDTERES